MAAMLTLEKLRQKDCEFEAAMNYKVSSKPALTLGCVARLCLKKKRSKVVF